MKLLDKLDTFLVLSECNSFTEAARRLYCSQPTISHHIQHLEEVFGARLFHRAGKTVKLTKQGEVLLQYARKINSLVEEASIKINNVEQKEQTLSIYVSNYIAAHFFSDILRQFHEMTPQKFLEINSYCYGELKQHLQDERTNFALMPIYPEDKYISNYFDVSILFDDEFVLILPPGHPWEGRRLLYPRDFHQNMVLMPRSTYLKQYLTDQLEKGQIKVRYLQMSNFEMIKTSVKSGHGIAFLPYASVAKDLEKGELITIPVSSLNLRRENGLVVRKNIQLSRNEQKFCETITQNLQTVKEVGT